MRITAVLIAVNVIFFILQSISFSIYCDPLIYAQTEGKLCNVGMSNDPFTQTFSLIPQDAIGSGYVWQFFTYMFLHGGLFHITFNMFILYMFGMVIEHSLGEKKYLMLYFVAGIGSALVHITLSGISDVLMYGASGAVFGILAAYGFMFPKNKILVFFIPIPALLVVVGFAFLEFFAGISGSQPGIANFGHLGGIITGILLMYYWKQKLKSSKSSRALREFEYFWE